LDATGKARPIRNNGKTPIRSHDMSVMVQSKRQIQTVVDGVADFGREP
jgi:hypothetical protein